MPVLYLLEQGSTLHKDGELFTVTKDGEVLQKIHAIEVEQIIIFGNVNLTTPVINHILEKGIDCVFCNRYGKFHGRLISTETRLGLLRLRQAEAIIHTDKKLSIAKSFVTGKLQNQRTLLMRYRREMELPQLDDTIATLETALNNLKDCPEISSLHGIEGSASASYYKSFREVLKNNLGFTVRMKRPPPDPVNSLLSFGYTLLAYNMQAAASIVGLDPFLGFLHSVEQPRPNLALDLMEEFRPIIVDSLVLWLVNTGVMTEKDFQRPDEKGKMVIITDDGIKKFIHHYEQKVQSKIYHPRAGGQTSYRHCFELQGRELAHVILNRISEYKPFLVR